MTEEKLSYSEYKAKAEEERQIKSARTRCWGVALSHFILAPVASIAYGVKVGKWAPTLTATGVALVATPVAMIDYGITFTLVPPITSAVMIINQVKDDRRRQQLIGPEQADAAYFARF